MQISSTPYVTPTTQRFSTGNNLPPNKAQPTETIRERPALRELASSIDPKNMSRNEALAMADALFGAGEIELAQTFISHGLILADHNGRMESATKDDPIMNERFNMFDAIQSQIEFNQSRNLSTESLTKALEFLDKFESARTSSEINLYA